jgi:hypothetical protein
VFHAREVPPASARVKPEANLAVGPAPAARPTRPLRPANTGGPSFGAGIRLLLLGGLLAGCEDTTTVLPAPQFGQNGQIQVDVRSPLGTEGFLSESLVWRSDGPWTLVERVNYRGVQGSETLRYSRLNPGELAAEYASLIGQLNGSPGLRLFGGNPSQGLEPICNPVLEPGSLPTTVTVTIRDDFRGESARWVRCARGTFSTITPGESGPDPEASRAITAAQLVRFFTLGEAFSPTYPGTLPYATLSQGEHSPALPDEPRTFVSMDGEAPAAFLEFWTAHAGADIPVPSVDWETEIVLLAAVGARDEAGDELRVTRVVPIGEATRVEVTERIPGDFCSPAAKRIHPFHLIVVPSVPLPIEFTPPRVERVPCGF